MNRDGRIGIIGEFMRKFFVMAGFVSTFASIILTYYDNGKDNFDRRPPYG
jgi:hypothetical protein